MEGLHRCVDEVGGVGELDTLFRKDLPVPVAVVDDGRRITSYNVCYTKLLRPILSVMYHNMH